MGRDEFYISDADRYQKCKEIIEMGKKVLAMNKGKDIRFICPDAVDDEEE